MSHNGGVNNWLHIKTRKTVPMFRQGFQLCRGRSIILYYNKIKL